MKDGMLPTEVLVVLGWGKFGFFKYRLYLNPDKMELGDYKTFYSVSIWEFTFGFSLPGRWVRKFDKGERLIKENANPTVKVQGMM